MAQNKLSPLLAGYVCLFMLSDSSLAAFPKVIHIPDLGLVVEGIAWDANRSRFVFGSIGQGKVSYIREEDVTLSSDGRSGTAQIQTLTDSDQFLLQSTIGMAVDERRSNLWVCQRDRSLAVDTAVQGAVALIDLSSPTGAVKRNVDLTVLQRPGRRMFPNDVITDDEGNAYVTDSYNDHVIRITPNGTVSRFATHQDWEGQPNQVTLNGIEYTNDSLLVGLRRGSQANIYKVPIQEPGRVSQVNITNGVFPGLDGIVFDERRDLLYVVSRENRFKGVIVSLRSYDNWKTAQVMERTNVPEACRTPTTAAFIKSGGNRGVWVICNNGFGQGPYRIQWVDAPLAKESRVQVVWFSDLFPDDVAPNFHK